MAGGLLILGTVIWQLAAGTVFMGKNMPVRTLRDGWWVLAIEAGIGLLGFAWGLMDFRSDTPSR